MDEEDRGKECGILGLSLCLTAIKTSSIQSTPTTASQGSFRRLLRTDTALPEKAAQWRMTPRWCL